MKLPTVLYLLLLLNFIKNVSNAKIRFPFVNFLQQKTHMFFNRRGDVDGHIFRRASNVTFVVELDSPLDQEKNELRLQLDIERKKTIDVSTEQVDGWQLSYSITRSKVQVSMWIPENAPVGTYYMSVFTGPVGVASPIISDHKLYILFNPWSSLDDTYMPQTNLLEEFVGNEVGFLFEGNWDEINSRVWIYDQFKFSTLRAIMFILEKKIPNLEIRSVPYMLMRALSSVLNANDNSGVIVGKWSDNPPFLSQYTKPWEWMGSGPILDQYYTSGGEPVRYGQCWVFASVFTTVLRALGIASRPVTNFNSAHLSENDMVLDVIVDDKEKLSGDDYWNYHVWTEAWLKRKDLTPNDVGWQAADATPQERSDNIYQLGPASINFIRSTKLTQPHDAWFIYSEVNADILRWKRSESGQFIPVGKPETDFIGKYVLTKNVFPAYLARFVRQYLEITNSYKPKEGAKEERESFDQAMRQFNITPYSKPTLKKKRKIDEEPIVLHIEVAKTMIGQPLYLSIIVHNDWVFNRTVDVTLKMCSKYYDGSPGFMLKDKGIRMYLVPNEIRTMALTLNPEEYLARLVDKGILKIQVFANVLESDTSSVKERDFVFSKPSLNVQFKNEMSIATEEIIRVGIENPLPRELTHCSFRLQGLCSDMKIIYTRDIGIHENFILRELLYYEYACKEALVVTLSCKELNDLRGYVFFDVNGPQQQLTKPALH